MNRRFDDGPGNRFRGEDVHEFVVTLVIAAVILGLMLKIAFF